MTFIGVLFFIALVLIHASSCSSAAPAVADNRVPADIQCTIDSNGEQVCEAAYEEEEEEEESGDLYSTDEVEDEYEDDDEDDGSWWKELTTDCKDYLPTKRCTSLTKKGECEKNPGFMKYTCPSACDMCDEFKSSMKKTKKGINPCIDHHQKCKEWGGMGECAINPDFMLKECARSCFRCYEDTTQFGVTQNLPTKDDKYYEATVEVVQNTSKYMKEMWSNKEHNNYNYKCRNMEENCSFWVASGDECETNRDYMQRHCAPACQLCNLLDVRLRCPTLPGNEAVFKPGELNTLFENIVDNADGKGEYIKYNSKALSRPKLKRDGTPAGGDAIDGPWIVLLENFVSDIEADALIAAGAKKGYERSADVGVENPDGSHEDEVNDGRTSENAWCDEFFCGSNPVIRPVIERIAEVTYTHADNHEDLQLLRYEPGQCKSHSVSIVLSLRSHTHKHVASVYNQHHDYIEYQADLPCGVRMLTLFLYLNDVEEGGGTSFPDVNKGKGIVVLPRKGNALLWPSVLDEDPEKKDGRTEHEALPVLKGIKYGKFADVRIVSIIYVPPPHRSNRCCCCILFCQKIQVQMHGSTREIIRRQKRMIVLEQDLKNLDNRISNIILSNLSIDN